MGEGLKRIARTYGGMIVTIGRDQCQYVANPEDERERNKIRRKFKREGWRYVGPTDDGEFLRFSRRVDD